MRERPVEVFQPEAHPPDPAMVSASEDSLESASVSLTATLTKEPQVLVPQAASVLALSAMEQPVLVLQGSRMALRLVLFPPVYRFAALQKACQD